MCRIELGTHRVRTERGRERSVAIEKLDRRQCAWIGKDDPRAVLQLEYEAREPRQRVTGRRHNPVTRHAKVHMQCRAVVEHGELMLPTPLDTRDRPAAEPSQSCRGETTTHMWMKHPGANDSHARRRALERARRILDLRKLGHVGQRTPSITHAQACAIDSAACARRV